ncbi:MAG: helix-turn-helix domain-containing protein [Phycisphaeraceae bacterium]|nr:helix-turn-helix domain-containing protein [Phycisphaeraceae bacterium]
MPRIIRHALYDKVSRLRELRQFCGDFELATGLRLSFVDDHGEHPAGRSGMPPLCRAVQSSQAGHRLCRLARSRLLAAAKHKPACVTCDAGLVETAVPVRVSGIVVGYLQIAGIASRDRHGRSETRRIERLLREAGVPGSRAVVERGRAATRVVSPPSLAAHLRILDMAARQVAMKMTAHLAAPTASLPRLVDRACKSIRRRALAEDLHLGDVARECGVSNSHLSRVFHHTTGLTFREYIARCRAEQAQQLLLTGNRPITQIAFDSGFRSLSQFNRVFKRVYGRSPRQTRDDPASTAPSAAWRGDTAQQGEMGRKPTKIQANHAIANV